MGRRAGMFCYMYQQIQPLLQEESGTVDIRKSTGTLCSIAEQCVHRHRQFSPARAGLTSSSLPTELGLYLPTHLYTSGPPRSIPACTGSHVCPFLATDF